MPDRPDPSDTPADNTVSFAERLVWSDGFKPLYGEGMTLVEQAAEYLDGDGRAAARSLSRVGATLYAAESMRLTTRLMQIASWLLLQRAANSGEMSLSQVVSEKAKIRLDTASARPGEPGWDELPEAFLALVNRSLRLQERVMRLDANLAANAGREAPRAGAGNPVESQITLLKTAFGAR